MGSQLVSLEDLTAEAEENGGECEMAMVVDAKGSLPPAEARLVDVDEAREALLDGLSAIWKKLPAPRHIADQAAIMTTGEQILGLVRKLFPEGE